jgi:uncharacterized membrane protein YfcA
MDLLLIGIVALTASALTFFSGFGLGTIMVPALSLMLPIPVAVAAAALVHFLNNLLKFGLMARRADWGTVAKFGLPAAVAAVAGALLLGAFAQMPVLFDYELGHRRCEVTAVNLVIGVTIVLFAVLECWPRFAALALPSRWIPFGGVLSGFFGGLSGNQGALRTAFLLKAGLGKEAFIATGVACAAIVDVVRLGVYGGHGAMRSVPADRTVLATVALAAICALAGTIFGRHVLDVVAMDAVRRIVVTGMVLIGAALAIGVL